MRRRLHTTARTAAAAAGMAALLGSAGCEATPVVAVARPWLLGVRTAVRFVAEPAPRIEVVRRGAPGSADTPFAAAGSVRLLLGAAAGALELEVPFASARIVGERLEVACGRAHSDHRISVVVALDPDDRVHVTVSDEVRLASEVRELAVSWQLVAVRTGGPLETFGPPGALAGSDEVAGDSTWRTPLAYVRSGSSALSLEPDIDLALASRRLPQGLAVAGGERPAIRHGLMSYQDEVVDGRRRCRRVGAGRILQGETVTFAHRLQIHDGAEPLRTLHEITQRAWFDSLAADPTHLAATGRGSAAARVRRTLDSLRAQESTSAGESYLLPRLGSGELDLVFDVDRQPLLLANALARRPDAAAQRQARDLLRLALAAPRRSGLANNHLRFDAGGANGHWDNWCAGTAAAPAGAYHATDTAWTRTCMLWVADRLPADDPLRARVAECCQVTARFLFENQLPSGAIPAFFEPRYLTPLREPLYDPAPETGAAALLLAEWSTRGQADAERAQRAALAAVEYLARRVAPARDWRDAAAAKAAACSTTALALAALAALRLCEVLDHTGLRRTATLLLDELTLVQQTWSPFWLQPDALDPTLRGGFGRSDLEATWSDPSGALAGLCLLRGYAITGRRDYLQRGAAALRSTLAQLDHRPIGAREVAAAAVAAVAFDEMGDAVIDLRQGFVECLEALWVENLRLGSDRLELDLLTRADLGREVRLSLRDPPTPDALLDVLVNGTAVGRYTAARLAGGVTAAAFAVPDVIFAPPAHLQSEAQFWPRAVMRAPPPPGWSLNVELFASPALAAGRPLARVELSPQAGGVWRAVDALEPDAIGIAQRTVGARLVCSHPRRTLQVPAQGLVAIGIGNVTTIDLASNDDRSCVDLGDSVIVGFADGRSLARKLDAGGRPLAVALPVPAAATEVALELRLAGRLRLTADGSVLHEDPAAANAEVRSLKLAISDRRLWSEQLLRLSFASPAGELQLDALSYRATGFAGAPGSEVGELRRTKDPEPQLHVEVVPIALADTPLVATREQIDTAFFGDASYRRTPEPYGHFTAGSAKSLLAAMSGGRTTLQGSVWPPLPAEVPGTDLTAGSPALAVLLDRIARLIGAGSPADAVAAVYGGRAGGARAALPAAAMVTLGGRKTPVVFLPERGVDGALLPVGDTLAALLQARYRLASLASPDRGNFGALALTATARGHVPAGPVGIDLAEIGWADIVDLTPSTATELVAAPVQQERSIYRLRTLPPAADELFLEVRGPGAGEPGLSSGGLLCYWRFARPPLLRDLRGREAHPTLVRLVRDGGLFAAVFSPGAEEDLLRRAVAIDDAGSPTLTTPTGELYHEIRNLNASEAPLRIDLHVEHLGRDLVAEGPAGLGVRSPPGGLRPLPPDAVDRGLGRLVQRARALRYELAPGLALRALWPTHDSGRRALRLLGRIVGVRGGGATLRIGAGDREHFTAEIEPSRTAIGFVADLPAIESPTDRPWIELEPRAGPARISVDRLVLVPRGRVVHRALPPDDGRGRRLMDGSLRLVRLVERAAAGPSRVIEPIVLPARRSMLRLVCGLLHDAAEGTAVEITVRVRSVDGRAWSHTLLERQVIVRGAGEQPLLVALLECPTELEQRVGLLEIIADGRTAAPLAVVTAEVARP